MKQYTTLILTLSMISFMTNSQSLKNKEEFVIKGRIKGLKDFTQIFLIQHSTKDTISIATIENGQFLIRGRVPNGTEYYYLKLDTAVSKLRSQEMLLENRNLELFSAMNDWPKITLTGSTSHNELQEFINLWSRFAHEIQLEKNNLVTTLDSINKYTLEKKDRHVTTLNSTKEEIIDKINNIAQDRLSNAKEFILKHPSSVYVPDIILKLEKELKLSDRIEMYDNLSQEAKTSYFGNLLGQEIENSKKRELVKLGAAIPRFVLNTQNNNKLDIFEIASKSKLTLINFWASWCAPCRKQVPNLKKAYKDFNKEGFTIVGVAINDQEEDWKEALLKDNTPWVNARDENRKLVNLFNIRQIPAYILIDKEGKVISFYCTGSEIPNFGPHIKGEALYNTLESLLKNM